MIPQIAKKKKPGRKRMDIDVDKIVKLYVDEKMSVRDVAEAVGVSHDTVARRIREAKGGLRQWRMPGEV